MEFHSEKIYKHQATLNRAIIDLVEYSFHEYVRDNGLVPIDKEDLDSIALCISSRVSSRLVHYLERNINALVVEGVRLRTFEKELGHLAGDFMGYRQQQLPWSPDGVTPPIATTDD